MKQQNNHASVLFSKILKTDFYTSVNSILHVTFCEYSSTSSRPSP